MNKVSFAAFVLVASSSIIAVQAKEPRKNSKPNIIFLMSDDHKATAMGCMGNQEIETPNLDRLAGEGVLFERCYATTPLCNPSRVTTMTGMYEYKTGANFVHGSISSEFWNEFSYPMLLKKAGYRTAFAGKWGFSLEDTDYNYIGDFDSWGGFERGLQGSYVTKENESLVGYAQEYPHVSRALGAFGTDFIEASAKTGKSFCLSISFKTPHSPHNVIDPLDQKRYAGVTFPEPPSFGQKGLDGIPTQAKLGRQYLIRKSWSGEAYQDSSRRYYQLISGMDAAIGMILQALEEAGVADNTVVIYTADNGYNCGEHGLQGKMLPYDSSARIPLIIYDPRSPSKGKGLKNSSVVGNIDFAPTMLDLAGILPPAKMDGVSLRPLIDNPSGRVRDMMLVIQNWGWLVNDHNRALAVVSEDWKYINWCYADENVPPAEELYSLKEDPYEMNNIADNPERSEMLAKYQKAYDQYREAWVKDCAQTEPYMRMGTIFDRSVPWQEKTYVDNGTPRPKEEGKKWPDFLEIYKELTGKEYKVGEARSESRTTVSVTAAADSAAEPPVNVKHRFDALKPNVFQFAATEARHVRVQLLADSSPVPCLDEFEIFSPGSQENLALQSNGAKATASSCLEGRDKLRIEHLNDGRYGNAHSWIPAEKAGWAQITLPEATRIDRVVLSRDRGGKIHNRSPGSFDILVSIDGKKWKTVKKVRPPERKRA